RVPVQPRARHRRSRYLAGPPDRVYGIRIDAWRSWRFDPGNMERVPRRYLPAIARCRVDPCSVPRKRAGVSIHDAQRWGSVVAFSADSEEWGEYSFAVCHVGGAGVNRRFTSPPEI